MGVCQEMGNRKGARRCAFSNFIKKYVKIVTKLTIYIKIDMIDLTKYERRGFYDKRTKHAFAAAR